MKFLQFIVVLLVLTVLSTLGLQGYDVNKDLKNLGPIAFDVAVVLNGHEDVIAHYDGYQSGSKHGHFSIYNPGKDADGNTILHWQGFTDGDNNAIDNGQVIHVGWSTKDKSSKVIDMYWTNYQGRRIMGNVIINITPGWVTTDGMVDVTWRNDFVQPSIINIRNLHFTTTDMEIPLAELNAENNFLQNNLIAFPTGGDFDIAPGEEVTLRIPTVVLNGTALVLRYEVMGTGSDAEALDFVQFVVE
jgi:hypothetical protein